MTTIYSTDGGTTWLEKLNYSTMIDGDYFFKFKFIVGDIMIQLDNLRRQIIPLRIKILKLVILERKLILL